MVVNFMLEGLKSLHCIKFMEHLTETFNNKLTNKTIMEYVTHKDITSILRKAIQFIKKEDTSALDELSDHAIRDASVFQDKNSIRIAIIIYALAKIIHRSEGQADEWDKTRKRILTDLQDARFYLEKGKEEKYKEVIKNILKNIGRIDDKLKLYIDDVLDKAKIVKGSKLYEQGVSIGRAAEILGISQWELMSYVGKTKIIDRYKEEVIPISMRLDYAKKIFGI